jgi:hypothetical protein
VDIIGSPSTVTFTTQFGAHPQVLQPGQVVDALVLRLVDATRVQLSIANLVIEVQTQVPLVPGTTVKLAVKGTPDNLKLQLLPTPPAQGTPASAGTALAAASVNEVANARGGVVAIAADAQVATNAPPRTVAPLPTPAAANAAALSEAVRSAAATQQGLGPLFADAAAVAKSTALPEAVRQAATQLLALRVPIEAGVAARDLQQAFSRSGLFLERQLAAAATGAQGIAPNDLKAALIVMRQVLSTWLGNADPPEQPTTKPTAGGAERAIRTNPGGAPVDAPRDGQGAPANSVSAAGPASAYRTAAVQSGGQALPVVRGPSIAPNGVAPSPQSGIVSGAPTSPPPGVIPAVPGPEPANPGVGPNLGPSESAAGAAPHIDPLAAPSVRPSLPPPYRGAAPAAQPVAMPSVVPDTSPREIGRVLLADTDGALARTTLLQAASVPDHGDPTLQRAETSGPRWHFEIPFATPQGQTAVAQFEIARDGHANPAERVAPAWRARFSLDVEPIGPVHAQIALTGARAAVTLWAERPDSAARLRENAPRLGDALRKADLESDVLVRDGAPPRPREAAAPAGRFVDRAS